MVYTNTNLVTQSGVYNEPLSLVRGTGGGGGGGGSTISPPLGIGINRGQQIP